MDTQCPWPVSMKCQFCLHHCDHRKEKNHLRYHKVLLKSIAVLAENHWHRIRNTDSKVEKCRVNSKGTKIQQRGSRPETPSPQNNSIQGPWVELRSTCMSFCLFWNVPMMPLIILAFFLSSFTPGRASDQQQKKSNL